MRLLVTGAAGFLGRYVVATALQHGHHVRALDRPESLAQRLPWAGHPALEAARVDLSEPAGLPDALRGVDAVIHLAAAKEGSFEFQHAGTVLGTANLLESMRRSGVSRLVLIGTFSVFDYLRLPEGELIDESSPLEREPELRDAYARTKLMQEQMVREFARAQNGRVSILRAGVLYGRGHLWNARLGVALRPNLWLRIGQDAEMPLTYVENCADAIVSAAERPEAIGETLHIVDDNLPTQRTYADAVARRVAPRPWQLPVGWGLMQSVARATWEVKTRLLGDREVLPGILVPARLHARFKSLRYSNERAKRILAWSPRFSLEAALERSCGPADPLEVADAAGAAGAASGSVE